MDLLEPAGFITQIRMFGGFAIRKNSITFALVFNGEVYFKVGDSNRLDYLNIDSRPFTYTKNGKNIEISNWSIPADILEDSAVLMEYVSKSYEVALRSKKK
jgi:DNA transformation protein